MPSAAVLLVLLVLCLGANAVESSLAAHQLTRARDAAERLDYSGTLIQQQGPAMKTSRIIHQADARGGSERNIPLEGPPREYLARGEDITWYLPAERRIVQERRSAVHSFPALAFTDIASLLRHYRADALPSDRVAGRAAQVMQLRSIDGLRYGYRFWFDVATGLMLRVQSINETEQVVAQTGFSQLVFVPPSVQRKSAPRFDTRGWRIDRVVSEPGDLSGWTFRLPAGFRLVAAQRRVIPQAQSGTGEPREVLQAMFSDGLSVISIFIEPWSVLRSANPVQRAAVNMVGKRVGKFWLTIIGEIPMAAVRQIADTLEFSASATK